MKREPSPHRLLAELGPATDEELDQHFTSSQPAALARQGAAVHTARIDHDGWRILEQARDWLAHAENEPLLRLAPISPGTLRLAARALLRLGEQGAASGRESGHAEAAQEGQHTAQWVGQRDILFGMISSIAGGVEPHRTRLREGCRQARDPASIAATMATLGAVGEALLKEKTREIVLRRNSTRLRQGLIDEARAVAEQARRLAQEQGPAPLPPGAQRDLLAGQALALLRDIVDAFDRAHLADPDTPQLTLSSLRKVLRQER